MSASIPVTIFKLGGSSGIAGTSPILDTGLGIVRWGALRWSVRDGVLEGAISSALTLLTSTFWSSVSSAGRFWVFSGVDIINCMFWKEKMGILEISFPKQNPPSPPEKNKHDKSVPQFNSVHIPLYPPTSYTTTKSHLHYSLSLYAMLKRNAPAWAVPQSPSVKHEIKDEPGEEPDAKWVKSVSFAFMTCGCSALICSSWERQAHPHGYTWNVQREPYSCVCLIESAQGTSILPEPRTSFRLTQTLNGL